MGRCIRHKYDYGAIVLLDERCRKPNNQKQFSRWVRNVITVRAWGLQLSARLYQRSAKDTSLWLGSRPARLGKACICPPTRACICVPS
jgi:hypothetical protein